MKLSLPALALCLTISGSIRAEPDLAPPDDVEAAARGSEVRLHWRSVLSATYLVFRSADGDSPRRLEEVSGTSFDDSGVRPGQTYVYYVQAKRDGKVSAPSSRARIIVALAAPDDLHAEASEHQIQLSWSRVSGASEYSVKRSGDQYGSFRELETTSSTRFTDRGLAPGSTYYYVIEAKGAPGATSRPSRPASATIKAGG